MKDALDRGVRDVSEFEIRRKRQLESAVDNLLELKAPSSHCGYGEGSVEQEGKEDLIIPRSNLVELVRGAVRDYKENSSYSSKRLVDIAGPMGIGKTTLLMTILNNPEVTSGMEVTFVDLEKMLCGSGDCKILDSKNVPLQEVKEELSKVFGSRSNQLIVIDNSEWISRFPELRSQVIEPWVKSGKGVLVSAGRFFLRWGDFSVRYRLISKEIPSFTLWETTDLAQKYGYKEKDGRKLYHNYTWGHPGTTERILRGKSFKEADVTSALEDTVAVMVANIRRLGLSKEQERVLYEVLIVGSILRVFSIATFKRFYQDVAISYNPVIPRDFQESMRVLQDATLVTWSNRWGGYVIDQPVRYAFLSWIRLKHNKVFSGLHCWAKRAYADLALEYPMAFPNKVTEFLYHNGWEIKSRRTNVAKPLSTAEKETIAGDFKDLVDSALKDVRVRWNAVDLLDELEARLEDDEELEMLLGEDCISSLVKQVGNFREQFL